jgi:hypothetical protein
MAPSREASGVPEAVARQARELLIGFLLYSMTAGLILAGYGLLKLFLPPLAQEVVPAARGAIFLLTAAPLSLWKPRVAAGFTLFGVILIWPVCLLFGVIIRVSFTNFYFAWLGLLMFPGLVLICLLLALATLYAFALITKLHRYADLPIWLFPQESKSVLASNRVNFLRPDSMKTAMVLLYAWWGTLAAQIMFRLKWIFFQKGATINPGYAAWVLDAIVGVGALWIVMEVGKGKSWARLAFLLLFLVRVWSLVILIRLSPQRGFDFAISLLAFVLEAAGLALVFNKASAAYFAGT